MEKKFYIDFFLLKKVFLQKMNKIYISFKKYFFYPENIYSFCKKYFLIIKNIFVKTSW